MTNKRIIRLSSLLLFSIMMTSCGVPQSELDAANKRIAELEASLKQLQASGAPASSKPSVAKSEEPNISEQVEPVDSPQPSQWQYAQNEDKMTGGKTYYASVTSSNSVNFAFPYSGPQNATLTLRNDPKYGNDVIFRIEKGQILCTTYDGCNVLVRFDDGKPATYSATPPADNSSETIFISNYTKFLTNLKKAKIVRISPTIYQEGAPVFEFDTGGFDTEKYKPKD